jgi:hypothetical protein
MGKKSFLISLIVLVFTVAYFYRDFENKISYINSQKSSFKISQLNIPEIKIDIVKSENLADYSIWDIVVTQTSKEIKTGQGIIKKVYPKYEIKKFGKVEAIYKVGKPNDRWEFYGIIKKGKNSYAIFYNPSLKENKWRLVKEGEQIDENLTIKKIGSKNIIISYYKNENETEELQLKVFYVEEEKFKRKEKDERSLNENKKFLH